MRRPGVDLYWLPLGAGGHFVRLNGRIYERLAARREHRAPLKLFHTALEVTLPEGRVVIENAWPIPDADCEARGVTVQGPVFTGHLARYRVFRYEVRRWSDGVIADIAEAVESPQRVSDDEPTARRIVDLTAAVPPLVWGRRVGHSYEMWNSNSVIAWLLARGGVELEDVRPPQNGRAPGWSTGIEIADTGSRPAAVAL